MFTESPLHFFAPATPSHALSDPDPIVGSRVELQLLTTLKCNLKCSYCSLGVGEVLLVEKENSDESDPPPHPPPPPSRPPSLCELDEHGASTKK